MYSQDPDRASPGTLPSLGQAETSQKLHSNKPLPLELALQGALITVMAKMTNNRVLEYMGTAQSVFHLPCADQYLSNWT